MSDEAAEMERDRQLLRAAGVVDSRWIRTHRACSEDGEGKFQIQKRPLRVLCVCGDEFRVEGEA